MPIVNAANNTDQGRTTHREGCETVAVALKELKITLLQYKKITSINEADVIINTIDKCVTNINNYFIENNLILHGERHEDLKQLIREDYQFTLKELIDKFDGKFPLDENGRLHEPIRQIFLVPNRYFCSETWNVLIEGLTCKNKFKTVVLMKLLEELISSDSFLELLLFYIVGEHKVDYIREDMNSKYSDLIQVLVTLPDRVSNILHRETPDSFSIRNISRILLTHVVKIIFVIKLAGATNLNVNYQLLSILLSKILLHHNENYKSISIINFIKLLSRLCSSNEHEYKKIIHEILNNLQRPSIETFSIMSLQNLDTKNYDIHFLLNKKLIEENKNWNYILCSKIPFLLHFEFQQTNLLYNLITCLYNNSETLLLKLLIDLTSAWSNRSSIIHTSIEQHLCVSKLLILSLKAAVLLGITKENMELLKEKIHSGIVVHLESTVEAIRIIGMLTSEIVLQKLNENAPEEVKLRFEYDDFKSEWKNVIIDNLKSITFPLVGEKDCNDDIPTLLKALSQTESEHKDYIAPERVFRKKITSGAMELRNEVKYESIKPKNNLINIVDTTDFELDSDDDLEPYDVSNDKATSKKPPPAYLRDLRDGLLENEDPDVFIQSLENCEKLITQQLFNDDASIGLEILEILLTLQPPFFMENYDKLAFNSCVAITCTYPAYYAEYLCTQFHAEKGKYSIAQRILMLDILGASAKSLSAIKPLKQEIGENGNKDIELSPSEIVRKRLETKTKRYFKHKPTVHEQINRFANVAGSFFYPLLFGLNRHVTTRTDVVENDTDHILLIQLLHTLATVVYCSENCPIAPKMGKDVFNLSWILKFHKEAKVRIEIINLLCAAVLAVPKTMLMSDFLDELLEIRLWLVDVLSPNVQKGDPNSDCRILALNLMCLLDSVLKEDENLEGLR